MILSKQIHELSDSISSKCRCFSLGSIGDGEATLEIDLDIISDDGRETMEKGEKGDKLAARLDKEITEELRDSLIVAWRGEGGGVMG